ncbi:hypothetical protein OG909_18545 [Streptomyces sp. NBC_01754]|uniref:hypothetical protein n=1 Tax=Streptomyces sp. NBC_01754 TaxID=2975930 RepID=UPI002DD7E4D7|nr:hypothetical protein [Streptomyces sp. NBC_01754]WSC94106.1 hypothetical protein OG909_18545 [Streptomyces sp. NBC_01754]
MQKDETGQPVVVMLCEQDGTRVEDENRLGEMERNGDTLTVKWKKGATGTDTFERLLDVDPA